MLTMTKHCTWPEKLNPTILMDGKQAFCDSRRTKLNLPNRPSRIFSAGFVYAIFFTPFARQWRNLQITHFVGDESEMWIFLARNLCLCLCLKRLRGTLRTKHPKLAVYGIYQPLASESKTKLISWSNIFISNWWVCFHKSTIRLYYL